MNDFISWLRGLFGMNEPPPKPDPTDPCNAAACVDAKSQLATARSTFNRICQNLQSLQSVAKGLNSVLSTPIWMLVLLLVVLAVIGLIFGGGVAFVCAALAVLVLAVWAISWFLAPVVARIIGEVADSLAKQEEAVASAVKQVLSSCPLKCQGDVSIPVCNPG